MSHSVAFVNDASVVVQVIAGDLTDQQIATFLRDYRVLYGVEMAIPLEDGTPAWIGGLYDPVAGVFAPPPEPEIIEGTATEILPPEEMQP